MILPEKLLKLLCVLMAPRIQDSEVYMVAVSLGNGKKSIHMASG